MWNGNVPENPATQELTNLKLQAQAIEFVYSSDDDEVWILDIGINNQVYRVYVDSNNIEVSNSHTLVKRTNYRWDDYMLTNVYGQVAAAAFLCAIATFMAEITGEE